MSKAFKIIMGLIFGGLLALWLILAQPTPFRSKPSDTQVSAARLEGHVRTLSEDFIPRDASHIGNTKRTADYIERQFHSLGAGTVSDQWYSIGQRRYRNVSLLLGSNDPAIPRIIVGAHYDAYGHDPGADDNASGVAGMIELARLFAADPIETPIEFVGYPNEEPPYFATHDMGSSRHAVAMKKEGRNCRYMIALEMIGYFDDRRGTQDYPLGLLHLYYPSRGNYITVVGNLQERSLIRRFKQGMRGTTPLPVHSISGPAAIPGLDFSDHRNYWREGYPAIMITDTAFYRNKHYHTPEDTADRLDFSRMAMVVVGVYEAIRKLEK